MKRAKTRAKFCSSKHTALWGSRMVNRFSPESPIQTTVFLVRHGVTAANKENRFAGRTAEPLHPEGIEQVRQLGEQLRGQGISRIFAGPLARTRQTAEIISSAIDAPIIFADALTEISIPHWDGLTKEEIRREFGSQYPTWLERPADFSVPDCETLAAVQQRAVRYLERIFEECAGERVLVVSHLVVLRCLILHYQGRLINDYRSIKVANGAIAALERTREGDRFFEMDAKNSAA